MIRKIERGLKSYFYFNSTERRGVLLLLVLLAVTAAAPYAYEFFYPPQPLRFQLDEIAFSKAPVRPFPGRRHSINAAFADSGYKKPKHAQSLELNRADSESLVALYRIGPGLAHRILHYRSQLGGFVLLEQLNEIWGFDQDILYDLQGRIHVEPVHAKRFDLNKVQASELSTHPYFKYRLSNAIVSYRTHHGPFASLEDLKKIVLVNDSVYSRVIRYLYIAPGE